MPEPVKMTEVDFKLFADFVQSNYGIRLKPERVSFLENRLGPRLIKYGFSSFRDYIHYLNYGLERRLENKKMIATIVNNETYLNREYSQLRSFADHALPKIKKRKRERNEREVTVLSAGCSTGEEVYSLAIMAYESGDFFWGWNLKVIGVDISPTAIAKAANGVYQGKSFRGQDAERASKYFTDAEGKMKIKDSIARMTDFRVGNILDPAIYEKIGKIDAVFCRNVLIYFSEDKARKVFARFHDALNNCGYLFLGHSETLPASIEGFEESRLPGSLAYSKRRLENISNVLAQGISNNCG
jgi:chemotaxis protein methyltransferase CheR